MQFFLRREIAKSAAMRFAIPGQIINLGVGIPLLTLEFIEGQNFVHTEGGAIGVVSGAKSESCTDAGGNACGVKDGGCFFDSVMSFSVIRRGLVDVAIIGAVEVDIDGNVCNCSIGGRVFGPGGAVDLLRSAKRAVIAMTHCNPYGECKIKRKSAAPVTINLFDKGFFVVTERGIYEVKSGELTTISGDPICF